ncbi:MAG: hypothetical protein V1754_10250, partial [Pseudomonadota bacterium]
MSAEEKRVVGSDPAHVETQMPDVVRTTSEGKIVLGQVLAGRFRIVNLLGQGTMGSVCDAYDLHLRERIALKLLRPELNNIPRLLNHLESAVTVGREIRHPNVCRLYDIGTCGDRHFISMAFVPGVTLDHVLAQ